MDTLQLLHHGSPVREIALGRLPLEVGSGTAADVTVHDAAVPERAFLLVRSGGTVWCHRLSGGASRPSVLPYDAPLALGAYSLVRVRERSCGVADGEGHTDRISLPELEFGELAVVVGRGGDARRVTVRGAPVTVGTAPGNTLVLYDRAVSRAHARLDPLPRGLLLRDLGSRNGTFVDGVRVTRAELVPGQRVRLGRTEIEVVARGPVDRPRLGLVYASRAMERVLAEVERVASLPWPALVVGPSGAGKEGIARAVHVLGPRSAAPFVTVNAGGIPRELVESELFGHERGAFTGAHAAHRGVFEQAHGGTLFLDEVGELPLAVQVRLLRVLETWEVRRVGAEVGMRVDVRLVAATHRDLKALVQRGEFREDLYYRLARSMILVPPLRERPADIAVLARHFLAEVTSAVGPKLLTPDAEACLELHSWPGNARELRNVVCAAAASCAGMHVDAEHVRAAVALLSADGAPDVVDAAQIDAALERHGGNVTQAARALGVPRSTLRDRIRRSTPPPADDGT